MLSFYVVIVANGMLGLAFAALIAAIVSSLASLSNSVSTIFTMDIYRKDQDINDPSLVNIGRIAGLTGLVISIIVAPIFLRALAFSFSICSRIWGFWPTCVVFLSAIFIRTSNSRSVLIGSVAASLIAGVVVR